MQFTDPLVVATHGLKTQKIALLLDVMKSLASELDLNVLLPLIMKKTTEVMDADRSTLFLVDFKTNELWSKVAQGAGLSEIRFPNGIGIAGYVATSGEIVNIPEAYEDPRFNKEIDKKTGYRTKTILCMPVKDETGRSIGVIQVLNKKEGVFTVDDEQLLDAFCDQASIAIKNAKLFEEVLYLKNYNENILKSIATGVITTDSEKHIILVNPAAQRIFHIEPEQLVGKHCDKIFSGEGNEPFKLLIDSAATSGEPQSSYEMKYHINPEEISHINLNVLPLRDGSKRGHGLVLVVQDITHEQRLMSTLCRYVTREIAEEVLQDKGKLRLGGVRQKVTILFSDIRNFTGMSEKYDAEQIVLLLNDYFSRMIISIFKYQGTLDKFIGDAVMAVFGAPIAREDDALRAVEAAIDMRKELKRFNEDRRRMGMSEIETGIGLCDGEVISGNIGSELRMDYTVIGNAVNLASRLEGLTKNFDAKILFNEAIYHLVKDKVPCVEVGFENVKGKAERVNIFGVRDKDIL